MVRAFPLCLVALLLCSCVSSGPLPTASGATASDRLNAWFEAQFEEELQFHPVQLTMLGRKERNDQFDDMSLAGFERELKWQAASVAEMQRRFRYDELDGDTKLSWDLWILRHERALAGRPYWLNDYVFDQMQGLQSFVPTFLINFHVVDTEADLQAYVKRLQAVPRVMDQLLARTRDAARQGIRVPRFAQEAVIAQSRKVIEGAPFGPGADSALWADLQSKIDGLVTKGAITPSRTTALKESARAALVAHVAPAYGRIIDWFSADLANAAVNPAGVASTQRDGAAYYAYQLRENTTTELTADQIHRIGLDEVARLRAEMEALKQRMGFTGTLPAFFDALKADPDMSYPNTDAGRQAYLDASTQVIDNIRGQLPRYFGILPKAGLVVRRVEAYREEPGAAQHYFAGAPDGSRPGVYYVHLADTTTMPKTDLEVVAYHEGLPGHHMQISIAQELTGVPLFRREADFTVYAEGWALYAESLAKEMPGTFTDPHSDFGRLVSENWRAIRLVVDTGLHAMGWTEQQAVDYFAANAPLPDDTIRSEIQRYIVMPGQATSYKIGMIRIRQLRQKAQDTLGARFDIRAFHDVILDGGALPLNLLERKVDRWIEASR